MKTYQALADALTDEGVDTIFGLLGGAIEGVFGELQLRGCRFIASRHEQGAVGMADGYARATGRIGVACISYGPGLTNAGTALVAARCSKSRLLLITSDTSPTGRLSNMHFDQAPFIMATAGAMQELATPALLTESVELCLRHLRASWGPIVLNAPDRVLTGDLPEGTGWAPTGLGRVAHQRVRPDQAVLDEVVRLVAAARRPVLLAGRGAVWSDAREVLARLAERIGALVGTTLLAKSFFAGDPFDVGIVGGYSSLGTVRLLAEADLVIAFGASLSRETMSHGSLVAGAKVVQVVADAGLAADQTVADLVVLGDARATAEDLLDVLEAAPAGHGWRDEEMAARIGVIDPFEGIDVAAEEPGFVNQYAAYRLFDELLPADRVLLVDGGSFMGVPATHISVQDPRDLVLPWRFAAIGGSVGPAIGAAVGRPDRTVVLVTGDGGLMMNLHELDTAARYHLPLVVIVANNGGFAAERPILAANGWPTEMADYDNPDFGAVARDLGFDGYRVSSCAELEAVLRKVGRPSGPTLIELPISKTARYYEKERSAAARHG